MPSPQVERVSRAGPAGLRIGEPASASVLRQWAADLQELASQGTLIGTVGTRSTIYGATPATTRVTYRRSPWARWVTLLYEPAQRVSGAASGGTQVTFAGTYAGGDFDPSSSVDVALQVPSARRSVLRATWDVSGLTSGALYDFVLATDNKAAPGFGTLVEHPLGYLYPESDATDPAYASASAQAERLIQTGDLTTADGAGRLWALLEQLRTGVHHHYQWGAPEEAQSVATVAAPSYAQVIVQPRRMVSGAAVTHKLRVRYKTNSGVDGLLRVKQKPLSSGSLTSSNYTLPASTSWTSADFTWDSVATSDPRVDVRFGWDDAAVAQVAIIS